MEADINTCIGLFPTIRYEKWLGMTDIDKYDFRRCQYISNLLCISLVMHKMGVVSIVRNLIATQQTHD